MKASPELHALIETMTMSEKRFFKIFSARHGKKPGSYAVLFDEISKQEKYEEEKIVKKSAYFAAEKKYLHEAVLDSLSIYQRDKTYLAAHAGLLVRIELLYKRGLFSQCIKQIQKAKSSAYHQELFPFLLMFLRWETIIYIKNEDEGKLLQNMEEEIRINEILRIQYALMQLAFLIQIRIEKGNLSSSYISQQKKELKKYAPIPPHLDSFWTSYYYHSSIGLLATVEHDQSTRLRAFTSIKALMEASPQFIFDLPGIYHLNTNNLVNVMLRLGKYKNAEFLLKEQRLFMDKYGIRNVALGRIMLLNTAENELFLHYKIQNQKSGKAFMDSIETIIEETSPAFSPLVFDVLFMMAVTAFHSKDLRKASRILNRIFNEEKESKIRKELMFSSRLLYLMILFEEGDVLFESRYQSVRRLLQPEKEYFHYLLFTELLQLYNRGKEEDRIFTRKWKELRKISFRFTEDESNKQYDFFEWLERRIEKSPASSRNRAPLS